MIWTCILLLKEFDDYRDADDAVYELNGKELCGERLVAVLFFPTFFKLL